MLSRRAPHSAHLREGLPAPGITSSAAAQSGCKCVAGFSQLSLPCYCVTQPFCTQEKHCHPPGSQGSTEQGGPHPSRHWGQARGRMLQQPPWLPLGCPPAAQPQTDAQPARDGHQGKVIPPTALPFSSPGLALSHGLITSQTSTQCCVIVPQYLRDTNNATKTTHCLPATCLPAGF